MFDHMRYTTGNDKSPIAGALLRSLGEHGELSIPALRALSPLSERAQIMVDKAVVEVGMERLTFAADIVSAGLTYKLTDPLSVTQLEWELVNKVGNAQRTMSPSARGENQMPNRSMARLPIYVTTDDFSIGIRTLKMSQRVGQPLDTSLVKQATRSVNEAIEDAAINGATTIDGQALQVGGYTAPGLINAPNAETQALTAAAWTTAPVGATVFAQTQLMLGKLRANKKYGPYNMYLNTEVGSALDSDYDTVSPSRGLTIKERLLKIEGLNAIRTADMMPATKVAVVQMTSDVIDMVDGQRPTVIPWTSLDGFTLFWLVMAIQVPRVRSDYNGDSGVCIGTLA
jgi:hypothetical protein